MARSGGIQLCCSDEPRLAAATLPAEAPTPWALGSVARNFPTNCRLACRISAMAAVEASSRTQQAGHFCEDAQAPTCAVYGADFTKRRKPALSGDAGGPVSGRCLLGGFYRRRRVPKRCARYLGHSSRGAARNLARGRYAGGSYLLRDIIGYALLAPLGPNNAPYVNLWRSRRPTRRNGATGPPTTDPRVECGAHRARSSPLRPCRAWRS